MWLLQWFYAVKGFFLVQIADFKEIFSVEIADFKENRGPQTLETLAKCRAIKLDFDCRVCHARERAFKKITYVEVNV